MSRVGGRLFPLSVVYCGGYRALVEYAAWADFFDGLKAELDRIANALEQIVLNMEKPKLTQQDYTDFLDVPE